MQPEFLRESPHLSAAYACRVWFSDGGPSQPYCVLALKAIPGESLDGDMYPYAQRCAPSLVRILRAAGIIPKG